MKTVRAIYDPVIISSLKGLSAVCDLGGSHDQHLISLTEAKLKAVKINEDSKLCVWCEKHQDYVEICRYP